MIPIIYVLLATIIYSTTGVIIEQKLHQFNTIGLAFLFTLPFIPLAAIFLLGEKALGQEISWPSGGLLWLTIGLGALYFIADYLYIGSFNRGGDAFTIVMTIATLAPIVTAFVKYLWVGGVPNAYQIIGYVLAAAAVFFIMKGVAITELAK